MSVELSRLIVALEPRDWVRDWVAPNVSRTVIDTPLAFTRLADYALRDAKARGRNRVILAGVDAADES
jgi:hypothetical protein